MNICCFPKLDPLVKFKKKNNIHYLILNIEEQIKVRVLKEWKLGEKEKGICFEKLKQYWCSKIKKNALTKLK